MKLRWEDVYDIFDDASLWENGHDMYWYKLMWGLMEYRNMNEYSCESDKVKVISRAFAIIRIYTDFISSCFNDEEFDAVIESYTDDIFDCLYDESDVHEIFSALRSELGTKRTFYSMFITCVEFKDGQISYSEEDDEYEESCECDLYRDDYEGYDEDSEYDEIEYEYNFLKEEENDESDEEEIIIPENCSEDYYYSFESYLKVLASSSMSLLDDFTDEKAAGYIYLAKNMKSD